jgi:hypothetical protein
MAAYDPTGFDQAARRGLESEPAGRRPWLTVRRWDDLTLVWVCGELDMLNQDQLRSTLNAQLAGGV